MRGIIKNLRARRGDDGFTLIELMVVVLIIAILIAIAIPTFLGARERAQDRSAQSSLRNAVTAAKTLFTDSEQYGSLTEAGLDATERSLDFLAAAAASTGPKRIAWAGTTTPTNRITMVARSQSGKCFAIRDTVAPTGTSGTEFAALANPADCDVAAFAAATWDSDKFPTV